MGAGKKKKSRWAGIWTALLGALCALVLSVVFYGTMVYQLADDMQTSVQRTQSVTAADGYPELTRICKVAGLGGEPYRDGSYDYYVHETVCSGDTKGTAPFLMACCALEV